VSSDHQRQLAIDRILSGIREAAEGSLRSYATAVAESATDELRRQSAAETTHLRDTVQRLELTRIDIESQLAENRRLLEETRLHAEQLVAEANIACDSAITAETLRADAAIEEATRRMQEEYEKRQRTIEWRLADLAGQLAAAQAHAKRSRAFMDALASLDGTNALGSVLERLMQFAAEAAPRVALFLVKGKALSCWRTLGFDRHRELEVISDLGQDQSVVATAVGLGRLVTEPAADTSLATFSTPMGPASVAVPVSVSGRVIAVLYAETAGAGAPPLADWCPYFETVSNYAGRILEALTIQLAMRTGSSLVQPSHGQPGHPLSGELS
jgi:hypothetical protein